jgi:Flp pilus assembly protein CpaB
VGVPVGLVQQGGVARAARRSLASRLSAGHVVMLVAGLLGVLLTLRLVRAADESRPVLVAARDLVPGSVVDERAVRVGRVVADADVLASLVPAARADDVRGMVVTVPVAAGALLTRPSLRAPASGDAPRSISVPIARSRAVAGDVATGDRVDLVSVDPDSRVARYVADGVEVLAVAGATDGPLGAGDELTVTLAVAPDSALAVAAAAASESLFLVRATGAEPLPPVPPAAPPPAPVDLPEEDAAP